MNKEELDSSLKSFFLRISSTYSEKCSRECGIDKYEKFLCKIEKMDAVEGLNYQSTLSCFDRCLGKHFQSSILGVKKVLDFSKF